MRVKSTPISIDTAGIRANTEPGRCNVPGCDGDGHYPAPKSRADLRDYWWFCLDHVKSYNKAWDYCAGMTASEVEAFVRASLVGERPTWDTRQSRAAQDAVRRKMKEDFDIHIETAQRYERPRASAPAMPAAEVQAYATLGIAPGSDFAAVRKAYRLLVKEHHPDKHGGSLAAEERVKQINQAYAVLKTALQENTQPMAAS